MREATSDCMQETFFSTKGVEEIIATNESDLDDDEADVFPGEVNQHTVAKAAAAEQQQALYGGSSAGVGFVTVTPGLWGQPLFTRSEGDG